MRDVEYAKAWLILTEIGVEMQTFVNPSHEDNVMGSISVPSQDRATEEAAGAAACSRR